RGVLTLRCRCGHSRLNGCRHLGSSEPLWPRARYCHLRQRHQHQYLRVSGVSRRQLRRHLEQAPTAESLFTETPWSRRVSESPARACSPTTLRGRDLGEASQMTEIIERFIDAGPIPGVLSIVILIGAVREWWVWGFIFRRRSEERRVGKELRCRRCCTISKKMLRWKGCE